METSGVNINITDYELTDKESNSNKKPAKFIFLKYILPSFFLIFAAFGFINGNFYKSYFSKNSDHFETKGGEIKNAGKFNILSAEDLSSGLKDTVYTDKDCWLELKIDEQMVYQHWRDGHTEKYPVSTGNKYGGDPEALESRPGLFAIFVKEEHHKSTQFNSANMYHFMPFNQGIGFHSIDGTGYYAHLGVRPSSHGCIRMRHSDAEKLYKDCPLGTLVLARKGYSARTVAFAPKGFQNEKEYTKDEYKKMLALNLYNILNGKYYIEEREKFVVDPKVIPVSGVYSGYDVRIPEKQIVPRSYLAFTEKGDKVNVSFEKEILPEEHSDELIKLITFNEGNVSGNQNNKSDVYSTEDLVKKYFHNPIGILPYFGPKK